MSLSTRIAIYSAALVILIAPTFADICDDTHCLVDGCEVPPNDNGSTLCSEGFEERFLESIRSGAEENRLYTCCQEGYADIPLSVLETCSTDACASPDGMGGYDCSADGFIHPLVCDDSTEFKYARKTVNGNIYEPYICCTEPAGNSGSALRAAAIIWSALCLLTFFACSVLLLGILSSKKARSQGYNLYLVFLSIPDALFNIFSFSRNVVNLSGNPLSSGLGSTVHGLEWFHTAVNMWLNAFIVYKIHTMLMRARKFVRTTPPTPRQVLAEVSCIYLFASLWMVWSLILLHRGATIFSNTNAAWLTSKSVMCGPPFLYTLGACIHVYTKGLLPTQGRTRVLSIFFLRVVIIFLLTWVPFLILVDVTYYKTASDWMLALAYYFASLQGLLSVSVALQKPDVKRAVKNLIYCQPDKFDLAELGYVGSDASRLGRSFLASKMFTSRKSSGAGDGSSFFMAPKKESSQPVSQGFSLEEAESSQVAPKLSSSADAPGENVNGVEGISEQETIVEKAPNST